MQAMHLIAENQKNQKRMAMSGLMIASIMLVLLPNKLHSQSSDVTVFNFNSFAGNEADLIYQGGAYVPPAGDRPPGVEQGQTFVRLTETYFVPPPPPVPFPNRAGRLLYAPPIRLWDAIGRRQANFQTVIRGYIGNYYILEPEYNLGDGMSFFIAPAAVNPTIPPSSTNGHMGLYDASGTSPTPLLAVELDVNVNSWDPDFVHVGININNRSSVTVARWQDEVVANATRIGREVHRVLEARITYDARQRLLIVEVNGTNNVNPVRLEYTYDLKTLLPEWVQIGISASTSEFQRNPAILESWVTALHEVRGWSFISFMENDDHFVQDT